ncbi:hypothetical protein EsH8_I_000560 [Colletotrichum jinshuiense]
MENTTKRRGLNALDPEERHPKRRVISEQGSSHEPHEPAGHASWPPISGTSSEFHGNGVQNSGTFHVGGNVNIGVHERSDQDSRLLAELRSTDPRDDKARIERTKGGLLRDSYRWILDHEDFRRWHTDDQSRLLWIKGDPGKGKTMLLCGIIDELSKLHTDTHLLAYFFCQATDVRLNNAAAVLRGLVYLLLDQKPSLIVRVRKKYDHAGKLLFKDVNSWDVLSKMFFEILCDESLRDTVIVIDALDECEDLSQLLDLIVKLSSSRAKVIVSSRNWLSIEQKLQHIGSRARLSLELKENAEQVSRAVDVYITQCVSDLAALQGDVFLQDKVRQKIQLKANGTFLWVALVVQELREAQSWEVEDIMEDVPAGLNELYGRMVRQIQRLGRKNPEFCRQLLLTVATTYRPLHLEELRALTNLPPNISNSQQSLKKLTAMCGSFLTIRDDIVYLIHQSAKDFLTADQFLFPSGIAHQHDAIFSKSLQVMSRTLRRDVYRLGAPGFAIDDVEPPNPDPLAPAQYSCLYWVDHLVDGATGGRQHDEDIRDGGAVDEFLKRHYLHWLEALSLTRSLSKGLVAIAKLLSLVQHKSSKLTSLSRDALRFSRYHRVGMESSPLQVYSSALVFSPALSVVKQIFRSEEPGWIDIKSRVEDEWNACVQTLEGHSSGVSSVAFSTDGSQLVSASYDETIKLWDTATGQCRQTLKGHSSGVSAVAFSTDGRQLASASYDETIKLWNAITGQCQQTIEGNSIWASSMALSADGRQLASASHDRTFNVKLWDTATRQLKQTFKGHSSTVSSVAFSADGCQLASVSYDETVKLWNITTGQCQQTLKGHISRVSSIAFSTNGSQLASASYDETIKLWDTATGQCRQTLKGHRSAVSSVAFSADGSQLASASNDETVKLWDTATGQCQHTLKGHRSAVSSVAFSADGSQLASASDDETIKLWNITASQCQQTLEDHSSGVSSVAFSTNGSQLASASNDETVKLWDTATGQCQHTLKGHRSAVLSVAFSADGSQLASASDDKTIKLWNTTTGQCQQTLKGHISRVSSVAFSTNGSQLASASNDATVKLWDTATGQCQHTLKGHISAVLSVAFSVDGCQLASAAAWYDKTIKLWDTATGQCQQTLKGHSSTVSSVAFLADSRQLASASYDETVKLWDTATGQCQRTLGVNRTLHKLAFSKTGSQLNSEPGIISLDVLSTASPIFKCTTLNMILLQPIVLVEIPHFQGYGISTDGAWVTKDSRNIMWLPPEYRPITSAIEGSTLAIGCASGRVLLLRFSFSNIA